MANHIKITVILLLLLQSICLLAKFKFHEKGISNYKKINSAICIFISIFAIFFVAKAKTREKSLKRDWLSKDFSSKYEGDFLKLNDEKNPKICICSYYTKNIASYSMKTEKINRNYAKKHGYDYLVYHEDNIRSDRAPLWNKLLAIEKSLNELNYENRKYDFVFWIDSDAYFNQDEIKLEKFILPEKDFYICDDDSQSIANTGTFLLRNSVWSREFIKHWWKSGEQSYFADRKFHEQTILDGLLSCDMLGINKKLAYFKSEEFNSKPICIKKQRDRWNETFVVHLMALNFDKRNELIDKKLESDKHLLIGSKEQTK